MDFWGAGAAFGQCLVDGSWDKSVARRKEVSVYYNVTVGGVKGHLIKVGSEEDKANQKTLHVTSEDFDSEAEVRKLYDYEDAVYDAAPDCRVGGIRRMNNVSYKVV